MFFAGKGNNCSATTSATLLGEVEVKLPLQKEVMNFLSQCCLPEQAHHMPENHTPKQAEERKHLACLVSELPEKSVFTAIAWLQTPCLVEYEDSSIGLLIKQQLYFYKEKLIINKSILAYITVKAFLCWNYLSQCTLPLTTVPVKQ
uniref:Uncharacterized protein n=1 Tax=Geospiza parvula TaxID=87175 RepID=A0A8U8BN92_GEOPR